jgi:AcrR family transcriptional regulator
MQLVDREGTHALSMRRLGKELGVTGMSFYNHVPNKEALVSDVIKEMFSEIAAPDGASTSWKDHMRGVMRSFRRVGLAHRYIFQLYAARPRNEILRTGDDIAILQQAGFEGPVASFALRTLSSYVVGFVSREVAGAWSGGPIRPDGSLRPEGATAPLDEVFEFGLTSILDGLEDQLVDTAAAREQNAADNQGQRRR